MSCVLYLVRHGIAEERAAGSRDEERRLTPEGIKKMRAIALGLKRLGVRPDTILSSPLRRAQETARLLAEALSPDLSVGIDAALSPAGDPAAVLAGLRVHRRSRHLMLVGHQPDLGELASQLLTGLPARAPLPFKKGGAAAIEVGTLPPRAVGALQWFLTPKQLRAIAQSRG